MSVRIQPRGSFVARNGQGHEIRIHAYAVFDGARLPIIELQLKTETGADVRYLQKGRYAVFGGLEYASDDPEAP
jgi:hypothetical protein